MKSLERFIVIGSFANMTAFFAYLFFIENQNREPGVAFIFWNFGVMFWNFTALALTIRDLYLRDFPNPNSKLTWSLLMFWTGGIGWYVYLFKHAFKLRTSVAPEQL